MKYLYILLVLAPIVFFGCKKSDSDKYANSFWFYTESQEYYTITLYATEADYYAGTNPVKTYRVEPNGTPVDVSELGDGKEYYADYYNDSYTISNWAGYNWGGNTENEIRGIYFVVKKQTGFTLRNKSSMRGTVLNGKKQQRWKAVDAYKYPYIKGTSKSVWDSLKQYNASAVLDFNYAGINYYVTVNGVARTNNYPLQYVTHAINNSRITYLSMMYASPELHVYDVAVPIEGDDYIPDNTPHSKDTISVLETNAMVYLMVKE